MTLDSLFTIQVNACPKEYQYPKWNKLPSVTTTFLAGLISAASIFGRLTARLLLPLDGEGSSSSSDDISKGNGSALFIVNHMQPGDKKWYYIISVVSW